MTTRWPGVSSGSRSISGMPMLPPRTAGCAGSAARIACASADVVVLPFVPVTPIVGAGAQPQEQVHLGHQGRRAERRPPVRAATSAWRAARSRGSVVG